MPTQVRIVTRGDKRLGERKRFTFLGLHPLHQGQTWEGLTQGRRVQDDWSELDNLSPKAAKYALLLRFSETRPGSARRMMQYWMRQCHACTALTIIKGLSPKTCLPHKFDIASSDPCALAAHSLEC